MEISKKVISFLIVVALGLLGHNGTGRSQQGGNVDRTGKIIWLGTDNQKAANLTQQPSKVTIWKVYRNDQYGFSFEYPAAYDEEPQRENCGLRTSTDLVDSRLGNIKLEIEVGLRISLFVLDAQGSSLNDFVKRFIKEREDAYWILQSTRDFSISGVKGKKIEFRFGGRGGYGTAAFLKSNRSIFLFTFTAGAQCDITEIGITEFEVYEHIIKTFKIRRGGEV